MATCCNIFSKYGEFRIFFSSSCGDLGSLFLEKSLCNFHTLLFLSCQVAKIQEKKKINALGTVMLNNPWQLSRHFANFLTFFLFLKFQTANSLRPLLKV